MHSIREDLRYAFRGLVTNPGLAVVAVLTLALGIGANAAIFSYVDATWLRPLPVPDTQRLVKVFTEAHTSAGTHSRGDTSYQDYLDIRSQSKSLEDIVAFEHRGALLHRPGEVIQLRVDTVSPNFFSALGASAMLGRTFTENDFKDGRFPVVISHTLWQEQFGGDRSLPGKEIRLSEGIVSIMGVMPREFQGVSLDSAPAVWIPAPTWTHITGDKNTFEIRGSRRQEIIARLRSGTTLREAQTELNVVAERLAQAYPDSDRNLRLSIEHERDTRDQESRREGWMLFAFSSTLLLIACANVASLQLARGEVRRKEFATRLALGGSKLRLLQQVTCESLLLALLGLAAALLVANWTVSGLPRLFVSAFSRSPYDFRLDARVLVFTAAVSLLATILFAIAPALRAARVNLTTALKSLDNSPHAERRLGAREILVVGQVALSIVVLACAGMLIRTLANAEHADAGFDRRQNMLLVDVVPGLAGYEHQAQLDSYYRSALETMGAIPGVTKTAAAIRVPFSPNGGGAQQEILLPGMTPPTGRRGYPVNYTSVSGDYFSAIGTRLLRGRTFASSDHQGSQLVAVVNQSMAQRFWPNADPVGMTFRTMSQRSFTEFTVVGVVEDAKWNLLTEASRPILYLSLSQSADGEATLLLKTQGDPTALVPSVREALLRVDRNVPMIHSTSLKQHVASILITERTRAILSAAFGMLSLMLAAAGIYGVMSYFTSRRTHEIGLRMAFGAGRRQILTWVLSRGLRLILFGAALGVGGALVAARFIKSLLYGVQPSDPLALVTVIAILGVVALFAIIVPATRASSVDPMEALREL